MQYVIRFISLRSGVGKTTVASKVVSVLKNRGLVVGVVKHCSGGVVLEEKDTRKYVESGASIAVASAPGMLIAYYSGHGDELEEALGYVRTPLVVVEGYKNSGIGDAVLVVESVRELEKAELSLQNLTALYARELDGSPLSEIPVFKPGEEEKLAMYIEERAVNQLTGRTGRLNCRACGFNSCRDLVEAYLRGSARWCPVHSDVRVSVNGVSIELNPFVKGVVRSVIMGLLEPLRGVPKDRKHIIVEIKN